MTTTQRLIKYLAIAFAISLIVTIVGSVIAGFGVLSFVFSLDEETGSIQDILTELNTNELTPILDIDVAATELEIKIGEEFKVETNNKEVSYVQDGIKTKIVEKSHFRYSKKTPKLTIYIPQDFKFDEVTIDAGAGKITIEYLSAGKIDIDLGAGQTQIKEIYADKIDVDGGAGKMVIDGGELNNLDFDMGVGETYIKSKLTGNSQINAGVGKLTVCLVGSEEDYTISAEKGLGSISIFDRQVTGNATVGIGSNFVKVNGGVGSISINISNETGVTN